MLAKNVMNQDEKQIQMEGNQITTSKEMKSKKMINASQPTAPHISHSNTRKAPESTFLSSAQKQQAPSAAAAGGPPTASTSTNNANNKKRALVTSNGLKKLKMQVLQSTTSPQQSNQHQHQRAAVDPYQPDNKTRSRTESNQLDAGSAVALTGGCATNMTAGEGMMMGYDQEPDGIMRLNSLQVESNHAGGRLLDPQHMHQNLKLQLTAQNAAELSAMTAAGAEDELLSPNTSAHQCETTTLFSAQPAPQEESGTFEMGYITFFPKNQNDNFQTIPEQAPAERKPADQQTATNGWTSERPAPTAKEPPNTKPKQPKSPQKKTSNNSAATSSKIQQLKMDSTNISSTTSAQDGLGTTASGKKQGGSSGTYTLVPRRKILFLSESHTHGGTSANNQNEPLNGNGESERSHAATPESILTSPAAAALQRQNDRSRQPHHAVQQRRLDSSGYDDQHLSRGSHHDGGPADSCNQNASAAGPKKLKKKRQDARVGAAANTVDTSNNSPALLPQQQFPTSVRQSRNKNNGMAAGGQQDGEIRSSPEKVAAIAGKQNYPNQHQQQLMMPLSNQEESQQTAQLTGKQQLFLDQQVEQIMAKKEARMKSEPARKNRRAGVGVAPAGNQSDSLNLKPKMTIIERRTANKDTASGTTPMIETKRSSNKNGAGGPAAAKQQQFHPNAASVDTNVVSFMTEKPGTSDINQPSNPRKIKINRKLQRNGTTDTGTFRSSYYNKIRNDASIIDDDADQQQQNSGGMVGDARHQVDERNMAISSTYYEAAANSGQHSGHAVPQLQSVDSPKRAGARRQLEQQVLSTGKVRRAQNRQGANGSTIEGFESVNASALSNERIRMQTVNTTTQESTSQYYMQNQNYGIRSNISEINEAADFSTNLRSDYSVSSPKEMNHALPSIHQQQPAPAPPQNESIMIGRSNLNQQQAPPTTSYSTASTSQKHQKRYGGYGRTQQQNGTAGAHNNTDTTDATTMASYLESSHNSKYHQVASKFSTYEDLTTNGGNAPQAPNNASSVSNYNHNNPGMQFNYSTTEPSQPQVVAQQSVVTKQHSKSQPPSASQKKQVVPQQQPMTSHHQLSQQQHQQIAMYTHSNVVDLVPQQPQRETLQQHSPTPLQHTKSPAMYYPSQMQGGATTPSVTDGAGANGSLDYKDILDERFASPRVMVKQSQPLLSKNQFISYLNESTQDMPLSPKRRQHMKQFSNAPQQMISQSVTPMVMTSGGGGPPSYIEKFQAMQQAMQGASSNNTRSQHMSAVETTGGGTTYQNMRADEIIKKYHSSNTDVQRARAGGTLTGTVSPRQLDFNDRNIGTAVGNLNGSFVSDTLMASANMSIGSSRQQANRGAVMENMLQKIRNAVSPTAAPHLDGPGSSSQYLTSPRATAQLTPLLNQSVMSAGGSGGGEAPQQFEQRQDVGSRQSQVCRKVIEEFAQKYSTIDKKRGSINPRRQNPIVKQPVSKRQASRAADCQLSPRLPDCFLFGPANQMTGAGGGGSQYDTSGQNSSLAMSHSPVARRSQHQYNASVAAVAAVNHQQQKNSQLSHISGSAPAKMQPYHQHALVSTGNSIMQSYNGAGGGAAGAPGEMQQLSLMQRGEHRNKNTAGSLLDP